VTFRRYLVHGAGYADYAGDFALVLQVHAADPDDALARARQILDVARMVVVLTDTRQVDYEDVTDEQAWRDSEVEIRAALAEKRHREHAEIADEFRQDEAST